MAELLQPTDLKAALALRVEIPDAAPVLGATDLGVALNFRRTEPAQILDLTRVAELRGISRADDTLRIGAAVTWTHLLELEEPGCRVLSAAARTVGAPQIRNRGTLGGNIGTASPAGDGLPPLLALDARVELASASGRRELAVDGFFTGPGRSLLGNDELIVAIHVPLVAGAQQFAKIGQRNAMIISACSFAVAIDPVRRRVQTGIGSAGPIPLRAQAAEIFAAETLEAADAWSAPVFSRAELERFGQLVAEAARPIDDTRATARYRRHALNVVGQRTLSWASQEAGERSNGDAGPM